MPTISGVTFRNVIATGVLLNDTYDVIPYDANGVGYQSLVITVDSTLGKVVLNLPKITDFAFTPITSIKVVATTGATNDVDVNCDAADLIGTTTLRTLAGDGESVVLQAIDSTSWSAVVSL